MERLTSAKTVYLICSKERQMLMRFVIPIIHLKGDDIEVTITHNNDYGEDIYSFVNGQHTTQGGTHQQAFREAYVKTLRDFYKKDYDAADIRTGIVAAIAVRVVEPVFESQTKTKLGSLNVDEGGPSMRQFVGDFLSKELDNYLHKNPSLADALKKRIEQSERERKELAGSKNWLMREQKKPIFIIVNFAIAGFIGMMNPRQKIRPNMRS
jgi:topoisomerase-4 subunit B